MASNLPNENIFDEICQQIIDTFGELIKQLTDRRDQLLGEVRRRKSEFEERLNSQRESLEQLETVRIQIEQISLSQTQSSNLLQSSLAPIQKQISDLKTELVPTPNIKFECSLIPSQLRNVGAIIVDNKKSFKIDYSRKVKATHVLGDCGKKFQSLKVLHIVGANLYVFCDSRVHIFETRDWSLKRSFELKEGLEPKAVAMNKEHCYIISPVIRSVGRGYSEYFSMINPGPSLIYKLCNKNFGVMKEEKGPYGYSLTSFCSLAILKVEIFIYSNYSQTICVFDLDLYYRRRFELPSIPKCIQIKENLLFVLDELNTSLHSFDDVGKLIESSHEFEITQEFLCPFCFDPSGNAVLVSNGQIIVVTPNGEEIYSIGKGSQCSEDISRCNSVAVFQDKLIVGAELGYVKIF